MDVISPTEKPAQPDGTDRNPSVSKCSGCDQYFPQGHIHYYSDSDSLICVNCMAPDFPNNHVDPVDSQACIDNGGHEYDSRTAQITYNKSNPEQGIHFKDSTYQGDSSVTKTFTCDTCGLKIRETFCFEEVEIVEDG